VAGNKTADQPAKHKHAACLKFIEPEPVIRTTMTWANMEQALEIKFWMQTGKDGTLGYWLANSPHST